MKHPFKYNEFEATHLDNSTDKPQVVSTAGFMTINELAKLLRVSLPVAYELANRDDFPSFKVGKSIRISKNALDDWILNQFASKKGWSV